MKLETVLSSKRLQGRKELVAYLQGKRLTYRQACLAKCFECMGGYADGAADCRIPDCPLYPRMPFRDSQSPPKQGIEQQNPEPV